MNPMNSSSLLEMARLVQRTAQDHDLFRSGDKIVIAVSGGPDSIALLHVLHYLAAPQRMNLGLVAAHVNHGFRAESAAEADIVAEIAACLGVPCEIAELDLPAYIEDTGMNAQAAARERRYEFLHRIAGQYSANKIALAHHADDQAETVMMRILRGAGAAGLAGIPVKRIEKNVELIRPFLRIYKTDLIALCENNGFTYVTDLSNDSRKYVRNQIRLDVLPFLGQYNRQIPKALGRIADLLGADNDYMEQVTNHLFADAAEQTENGYMLDRVSVSKLHVALQRRFIKLILSYLAQETDSNEEALDFDKIEAVRQGILQPNPTTWKLELTERIHCIRAYERIEFVRWDPAMQTTSSYVYDLHSQAGEQYLPMHNSLLRWKQVDFADSKGKPKAFMPTTRFEVFFDAEKVNFPLQVRNRRPGDRMSLFGLNGSKKVQDIFIDDKIAPLLRETIPIITDSNDTILWIPGVRRSAHAVIGEHTSRILHMELRISEDGQDQH